MPIFRLVDTQDETGGFLPHYRFDNGKDAADAAKAARESGKVLRVVREPDEDEVWRARDRAHCMFDSGTWERLPSYIPHTRDHFLHKSVDPAKADEGKVACYPSLTHLVDDRPVVMTLSRYLARFHADVYTPDAIAKMAERYAASLQPTTFHITRDAATVVRAFTSQPHCAESCDYVSCMAKPGSCYGLPDDMHPAIAYVGEGSSLSLAYMETETGTITARAIVSHENEIFVRVYGLEERHKTALIQELKDRGFRRVDSWDGERLARIKHPTQRRCLLMPYIDGEVKTLTVDDADGPLTFTEDGEIDGEVTCGLSRVEERETCAHCGETFRSADMAYVQSERWCESCVENYTWTCGRTGDVYPDSEPSVEVVNRWGADMWHENEADRHAFQCAYDERHYASSRFDAVTVTTPDGVETWCMDNAERYAVWHGDTEAFYHPDCAPTDEADEADDEAQRSLAA